MFEKVFSGSPRYWTWILGLACVIGIGFYFYLRQLEYGLGVTGLSRDVTWGFYIAQLTFLVGVAASAVMVVLPYYLHDYKAFGKLAVLGEFLAVAAVTMCLLFVMVDIGQPFRALNMFLHPTPNSILFWDAFVLNGYLVLNALITRVTLVAERKNESPPKWIKPIIYLSIPWAVSIHTVTAFLYCGLGARPFWMTAILAPRFLASAFASGPSLLILIMLIARKLTRFDPGKEAINKLAQITTYAMITNLFFIALEMFTAFYSNIPEHMIHFQYMFFGVDGKSALVPWMWTSVLAALGSLVILLNPRARQSYQLLATACVLVFSSIWIDKGMGMVVTGFVPSPLGKVNEYMPTLPEVMISLAIYAIGLLMVTVFYKIALSVRGEVEAPAAVVAQEEPAR
ncbi:MAG: polysulfide reductase NrfD [Deltaproteobacteria bacterium]|nr:polysulfide reductase NrfD [Deltaproteobacteria bacterium]